MNIFLLIMTVLLSFFFGFLVGYNFFRNLLSWAKKNQPNKFNEIMRLL